MAEQGATVPPVSGGNTVRGDQGDAGDAPGKERGRPGRSSGAEAYELLLAGIEDGDLAPGTRLREAELAHRLGLSRTPIREALKRLELQALVAHEPHHGAVVASLDYGQTAELYLMREMLEGTAARLAAQHATTVEIGVLEDMVARDRGVVDDPRTLARTNRQFHRQLRDAARNRFLTQALETLRLSLALLAGTTLVVPGRGRVSVDEHAVIVASVARRDPAGAEDAARAHIRQAFRTRIGLLQGTPG